MEDYVTPQVWVLSLMSESTYVCNLLKDALMGLSAPAARQTPEKFFI